MKIKQMLILIVLFIFLNICLLAVLSFALIKSIEINKIYPGETLAVNLGFEPNVPPIDQVNRFLKNDLEKTLVNHVCQQGGYDISGIIDEEFLVNSFPIKNFYQEIDDSRHPLKFVFLDISGDSPDAGYVCAYLTIDLDKDQNPPIPGVFPIKFIPINDPYIRK